MVYVKVDRLTASAFRRLTDEQKVAYDRLRWHSPGPAERARLKIVLRWRRTREETVALARELLAEGLMLQVVADRVGVDHRYLKRVLSEVGEAEKAPRKPFVHAADLALTCETDVAIPPTKVATSERSSCPRRFASLRDLDAWLEVATEKTP